MQVMQINVPDNGSPNNQNFCLKQDALTEQ